MLTSVPAGGAGLFFRVLGPLEVELDGVVVDVGGPSSGRFLAALLAAEGAVVSDSDLVELVWGDGGQRDVLGGLRVMVSRLRSVLGPAGRESLRRVGSGYRLAIPVEATDVGRFAASVSEGLSLLSGGEAERAAAAFESALAWWQGESWPELGDALVVAGLRARLAELREVAVDELQAARLELGQTATAVAVLSEAVIAAPYRERRWELLALGLYRGGRQAHALAELRRARRLLHEELGAPSPTLRELEQRLLSHDPTLLRPETTPTPTPPAAVPPHPAGISKPWTSLVGRAEELRLLDGLVHEHRLVTVLGPAGVGKTRLALEHAVARQPSEGETWLARLADIHTAADTVAAVAAAVGVLHLSGDLLTQVQYALIDRPGLLVLDNCEHLLEPLAQLATPLLTACPELRILTTSRARLGIDGEHLLPLDPLPVLDEHDLDGAAVELLFDRIRQHRAGWSPTEGELHSARQICTMLDGLPLAIELAAARERNLGLDVIATHLSQCFDVLDSAIPKGSINPHASLHTAIAWSIDLLDPHDRAFLLRLWPFEGGFTWHAAQAVQPEGTDAVLAVLASLVDRSVLAVDTLNGTVRYRMLETIRRYCADHDSDPAASQHAHASWVRDLVAEHATELTGPRAGQVYRMFAGELANIRACITYDLAREPVEALRTCSALEWTWINLGALPEGTRLLQAGLAASPDASNQDRAQGLLVLSIGSFHAGDPTTALQQADDALALIDETTDRPLLLKALCYRATAAIGLGDPDVAQTVLGQLVEETGRGPAPDWLKANADLAAAALHLIHGRPDDGEAAARSARRRSRRCGYLWGQGTSDLFLARSLLSGAGGQPARARQALRSLARALDTFQEHTYKSDVLGALYAGVQALTDLGAPIVAIQLRAAVLEHARRVGIDPRRYDHLTDADVEQRMVSLRHGPESLAAERDGRSMSWTAMIELFANATTGLLG